MLATESKPLGQLAADITVGYVGPMIQEYIDNGIPFLRSLNVRPHSFDSSDLKYISKAFHAKIKKSALQPGDVVIIRTGHPGISCVIPASLIEANCSDLIIIRCGKNLDPYFLSYYINFITYSQIEDHLVGAIQKHFNIGSAKSIPFPIISKSKQSKIASILKALDSKIELNNRINAELEAMAKTLYDYWFVQFDFPDENGKPYKSSGGKMVYHHSLKQKIPTAWNVLQLKDLFYNCNESISSSNVDVNSPYTPIDSLPKKRMSFGSGQSSEKANTSLIEYKENDILIGAMRVYFHRVCIAPFDEITRTTTLVLRPKQPNCLPYLFQVCNEERTISIATKISVGTQQPYVNWENSLENYSIPYPKDNQVIEKYCLKMISVIKEVINRERENAELAKLRDWLLPMLMNGQVTVQ